MAHSYLIVTFESELNVNSAIAKPDHDETILVDVTSNTAAGSYKVEGYAYAGGGRRVNRIEISLDEGQTWVLANMFALDSP